MKPSKLSILVVSLLFILSTGSVVVASLSIEAETVNFLNPIGVGTPTAGNHAATRDYIDSAILNIGIGGYVPTSRTISTTNGLSGGGNLTANRTLSVDSTVIRTTGNQTLGGTKTFSSAVVLSTAGTATTHAVRADRSVSTGSGLSGGGNLTANRTLTVDSTVIRTTGNQTLGGTKTFSSPVVVATPTGTTHATTKAYVDTAVSNASSKWTTSGTNIYNANSGNVGIGATSPAYKLTVSGQIGTPRVNNPYLVLHSSSSGGNNAEQSAQISLGESGRGSASLHFSYIGSGYSYIGMGTLDANNLPTYWAMRMYYQNNSVYFPGSIQVIGTATVATPTAAGHATTKAYVDSAITNIGIGSYVPTSRTISTGSGLSGGGNLTADRTLTVDSTVVRTTGNQTIAGTKTFSSTISGSITGNAGTVGGLSVHAGRNNEVNKVVRTDASGYLQAGWINTTSGNRGTTAPTRIYASNDEYIRYYTPANFATVMDSYFVRTSGNQTSIAGTKNFTGNIGIGVTAPVEKLEVGGNVVANAYYYTSDIRLKENISNVENSLSKILKLQGISYNLIGNEDKRLGFSAQELQKIYPELVKEGSDGYLSIDGTGLIAPLVEAIKEQQREIDELKRKVEELSKN